MLFISHVQKLKFWGTSKVTQETQLAGGRPGGAMAAWTPATSTHWFTAFSCLLYKAIKRPVIKEVLYCAIVWRSVGWTYKLLSVHFAVSSFRLDILNTCSVAHEEKVSCQRRCKYWLCHSGAACSWDNDPGSVPSPVKQRLQRALLEPGWGLH